MRILRSILPLLVLALASTHAAAACTAITMSPTDVTAGTVGTPYNLTFSASGSLATPFTYEVTSGVLPAGLNLNAGSGAVSGTPTAAGNFPITLTATDTAGCSGGRSYVLDTAQGNQTISYTSTAPVGATVGGPTYTVTATATSGLAVAFTIDASASSVCSIAGSTVSFTGIGTCVIDANQAGDANYTAAPQVQQSFGVAQGTQTITFTSTAPANAQVNGPTYNVTATATSGLPVTFTIDATATSVCSISGSTVSFLAVGNCVIDANQAGDTNYAAAPQAQQTFGVGKNAQTITFTSTAPAGAVVAGPTYTVTATASSGLTVAFTIDATASSVCTISGSTVSFIGAGSCVIDANQAGDASYNPAPQVQQTFTVGKGSQTITFTSTAPAAASVGGATYTVTATASSGLTVALTIDAAATSVCSISGSTVSFLTVGNCVIDANQAGDANYTAAPQVQQTFAVGKGSQTITFTSTAPAGATVGGPTYTVTATSTSGLVVALTIDATATSVCSITGSTVSFIGVGNCVIDANQAGNANYNAAPQVQQTFPVAIGSQTITFTSTAPVGATVGGPTYTVTATASSGLPVTFSIDASAASVCSIAGSTVSFIGAGTCVIDANQAGNANYNAAPQVQQSFTVAKNNQTIAFTSTAPAGAVVAGPTYTVTATATSGLAVTFTIDASATSVCSITGSTVSFTAVGTCVIDANQAGNGAFNPAPQVQQSFAVGKGNQTITFTSTVPVGATVGGATYNVTATGGASGNPVTFTIDATAVSVCSITGSTVSFIGAGTCVIDANQAGDANYNAAPQAQQSFLVGKGSQTISFTSSPPATPTVGGPTYTVTATGGASGNPVTFTIDASATSVCSIAGSTVSFIGNGSCVVDANQAGNANYNAAPQVQQSFTVKSTQTITFTSSPPATPTVGGATYTVTASASSGLAVSFTIDASATSVCSIAGSTVSFIGAGTCVIDANQPGNASFYAAAQVQQSFTVKNGQTISFTSTAPAPAIYLGPTYTVTATATSGLAVTFTIDASASAVCSISGSTVSFIGTGICVIDANQAGNANFYAAPQVQQSFGVSPGAANDAYNALGNVIVDSSTGPGTPFSVTDNDTFPAGTTISAFNATSANLGTVTMVQAAGATLGRFTYNPPVGFTGTDSFTYTLSSNGQTAIGTVTFTVTGKVWFVNDNAGACPGAPCDGRETNPFTDTSTFQTANIGGAGHPAANDPIFIFGGGASYSGAITLLNGQNLIGQGAAGTLAALAGVTPQNGQVLPSTGGTSPVLTSAGVVVTVGTGNFIHGLTLGNGTTALLGSAFGTLTANDNVVINTNGQAINLTNGTLTATLNGVTSTGGVNNINLVQVAGTSNFGSGALSGASGTSFAMGTAAASSGGAATIAYAGTITQTSNAQAPVIVQNRTGGTLTLSGSITATAAGVHGISLLNNTGSTTAFSGGLNLSTGANAAFTATGGGTVSATQNNTTIVNTLTTTTGTALNVANTAIGASGLNFRSIAAGTAASGPANGVVLNNTGVSGGLTVTGTGAAGSGGTIQKTTTGNAIDMTSTGAVSLSWMIIQNSTHLGINGTTLAGFALSNSSVINNGTTANVDDGIKLLDVSGTATFTSDTVTGNHVTNLFFGGTVASTTVTNSLTVTNGTYGNSATNSGIQVGMTHTATLKTATFTNVTFSGNASTGLQVQSNDNSIVGDGVGAPVTGTVTVSGCTFTNNAGNTAIDIDQGGGNGAGQMYARLMNNLTMTGNGGPAINVFTSSSATGGTMKVRIDGNHVGNAGVSGSGTTLGPGIRVFLQGKTTNTVTIVNNVVRQTLGSRAIDVEAIGPVTTGQPLTVSDIIITGNDADTNDETNPSGSLDAIYVAADNQGSPAQINAEIHGNTIPAFTGANGCFDYPTFDGNAPWLYYRIATAGAVAKLFNFGGHANANAEISTTQTAGTAGADIANFGGVQLTAVPVNSIP